MCNLYSMTKGQQAIRDLTGAMRDEAGNLPPLPAIFPDAMAPAVRVGADGVRELAMMRWGMPGPVKLNCPPVTNIRNVASPHWRAWLGPAQRCLVPVTSFCEWEDTKPRKTPVWFALDDTRPLAAFAGIWTRWRGVRGKVEGEHVVFGFLTTAANAEVGAVHPKAMPVILRTRAEMDHWLTAPTSEALALQRALPDGSLAVVARGRRDDSLDEAVLPPRLL